MTTTPTPIPPSPIRPSPVSQLSARSRFLKRVLVSLISALVVTGIAVVLLLANAESVVRWVYLNKLTSDDVEEYGRGVNYLVMHVSGEDGGGGGGEADRAATLSSMRARLAVADDAGFDAMVKALALAGVWNRSFDDEGWMRYLSRAIEGAEAEERASIAAELAAMLMEPRSKEPRSKEPRNKEPRNNRSVYAREAVGRLVADEDAGVRLNALSAVANLGDEARLAALEVLVNDEVEAVAKRARVMLGLLVGDEGDEVESMVIDEGLEELARLEGLAVGSAAGVAIVDDMPLLLRVYAVRGSRDSEPGDLMEVFDSEGPALRDLAVVVAMERFDDAACAALAKKLIGSYEDSRRMAGAMLGGMCGADDLALETLMREKLDVRVDWIVRQHFNLGLMMRGIKGEELEGFDPLGLLAHEQFPPTTLVMGLNWMGRKEGLDWLLNPLGSAPVDLVLLFDALRYWPVLESGLIGAPKFSVWGDEATQRGEVERLREWYLMRRHELVFDSEQKVFRLMP